MKPCPGCRVPVDLVRCTRACPQQGVKRRPHYQLPPWFKQRIDERAVREEYQEASRPSPARRAG